MSDWKNKLYYGDNLDIMREHIPDESVDLFYLDPPFNSQASYNVLFKEQNGVESAAQIEAFDDTWHWDIHSEQAYNELVTDCPIRRLSDLILALRSFLGTNDMMAYLTMMAIRLVDMRRVLKSTGSIYLHCDPTASHYLKLVLDAIFGIENYRNEIVWKRFSSHGNVYKNFGKIHDIIFYYSKTLNCIWNQQYTDLNQKYVESHFRHIEKGTNRRYRLQNVLNPNKNRPNLTYEWNGHLRVWKWTKEKMQKLHDEGRLQYSATGYPALKQYLDESKGNKAQDIWSDIGALTHSGTERLGYPTQKPEALLERIINASSNEGDVVLDPFCGCGTTVSVAEKLHRKWIGIDITHLAISLMKHRLENAYGKELAPYEIMGVPKDIGGAKALAEQDKYQFEWWALSLVGSRPAHDKKKGADKGIDGYIYFIDNADGIAKKIVVQVKGGHVTRSQIATLKGDIEREKAAIGVFITLQEPTRPMTTESAEAGFYEAPDETHYPKLQILTIEELFAGKEIQYPRYRIDTTHRKAQRQSKQKHGEQTDLGI